MGHQDKGHFSAKHDGKKINKTIADKLQALAEDNNVGCAMAHRAGKELNSSPSEMGIQIDLLEYRITECQLGLFGYDNGKKDFDPDINIIPELNEQLETANQDGKISCLDCWNIAKKLKLKRRDVGSACEKKKFKIKPCQLGAF